MTRGRRYQRGQAIVLIAIMLAVVVGMGALAIDGSRAYALRRDLQAAVDAAALAAGGNFSQTGGFTAGRPAAPASLCAQFERYKPPPRAPRDPTAPAPPPAL